MKQNVLQRTLSPIGAGLAQFEKAFTDSLDEQGGLIGAMAAHVLSSPGKRIRPAMYLLSSFVHDDSHPTPVGGAVAIELIHTATLLHDDVNDGADQRRGKPALNKVWGNLAAVLMGDLLFARAFRIMVDLDNPAVLRAISLATERVAIGELLQVQETRNFGLTEEDYLRIIGNKTASLFAAACESGSLLSGDAIWAERFRNFGELVGLGFQIADDLLDYIGDESLTGKPLGNDLREGKVTLPLIFALRDGSGPGRERILEHLEAGGNGQDGFNEIVHYVREYGGFEYAQQRAEHYCARALEMIADVGDSEYKSALEELVGHAVSRQA